MTRPRAFRPITVLPVLPTDHWRPRTRGDCATVSRPCVYVGCKHNLYLDVHPTTGSITLNFPHLEPDEMGESCALDVADHGTALLEEIGASMGVTKERVRQLEERGLRKIRYSKVGRLLREFR